MHDQCVHLFLYHEYEIILSIISYRQDSYVGLVLSMDMLDDFSKD